MSEANATRVETTAATLNDLQVIGKSCEMLDQLPADARNRVLAFLVARYNLKR